MNIEVGSKWVSLRDEPYGANIKKYAVVEVSRVGSANVSYLASDGGVWLGSVETWFEDFEPLVWTPKAISTSSEDSFPLKPDGSVASYYDFPRGMVTLNDWLEYMGERFWLGDSFHLANIVKAATRWGRKDNTSKAYDARKFIYSGCRLLMKYTSAEEVHKTLTKIIEDPQFQPKDKDP
jgi:hypothetical protein